MSCKWSGGSFIMFPYPTSLDLALVWTIVLHLIVNNISFQPKDCPASLNPWIWSALLLLRLLIVSVALRNRSLGCLPVVEELWGVVPRPMSTRRVMVIVEKSR